MLEAPTVVYVDTLLLLASLSFLMDYLLLWATAKVGKMPLSPRRLVLGSGIGTAYFALYYLSGRGVGDAYGWFRAFPALVAVSFLMLVAAFYPLPWRALARAAGYFYFIAVSSGGAGIASRYALGWGAAGQLAASIAAILVIAELGWGIVQRSLWQRLYHVALEVELFGEKAVTQALLDTGNRLKDPLGGAPVIIVEHGVVARLMPEHLRPALLEMEGGDLAGISRLLASERWSSRFRVIPYSSLGREKGLLVGFRPDAVTVVAEGRRVTLTGVVIGISPKPLDPEGSYRALLHPELLEAALREGGRRAAAWTLSTSPSEGETSHASTAS